MFYFYYGAAAQYKIRKNFINLCHHEIDFGIPAQWHFSATSHGKGDCDGLGGTVKRLAALVMEDAASVITATCSSVKGVIEIKQMGWRKEVTIDGYHDM